jgi:hypothetical protein
MWLMVCQLLLPGLKRQCRQEGCHICTQAHRLGLSKATTRILEFYRTSDSAP